MITIIITSITEISDGWLIRYKVGDRIIEKRLRGDYDKVTKFIEDFGTKNEVIYET